MYAAEKELLFFETSAKTDMNVEELLRAIGMTHIKIKKVCLLQVGFVA